MSLSFGWAVWKKYQNTNEIIYFEFNTEVKNRTVHLFSIVPLNLNPSMRSCVMTENIFSNTFRIQYKHEVK